MAQVNKIDSNVTGLRIAEELTLGVLPVTPVWEPFEPNSYNNFGGTVTTIARNPINDSRQRKKGVVTDLEANGGFVTDLTQTNLQSVLQGFFFADFRAKGEEVPTASTAGTDLYGMASTTGFFVGSIVNVTGFTDPANNGVKNVTAVVVDTTIAVAETLVTDGSPGTGVNAVVVGFQAAAGDVDVDSTGTYPALTSTILDFADFGLTVGEWIYVGGDLAAEAFTTAANNGFKRVKTIATNRLEFDKSVLVMVTEASTTETIRIFLPRTLKNELGTAIKRRTYQMERTLGASDDAQPTQVQAEYLVGAVANEFTLNVATADKLTADLSFIATNNEQVTGVTGIKSGTRPTLVEADAFNTSSDFSRIKMSEIISGNESPDPLFAFVTDANIVINNNISPNKAVGTLGAFDVTAGTFQVSGSVTAYFSNVTAVQAIRENKNVTIDFAIVKNNAGVVIDLPLISLGDGQLDVTQDESIKIPISLDAATAALIDPNTDYTLMMCFFDRLPTAAG